MAGSVRIVFEGESFKNRMKRAADETLSMVAYGISGGARDAAAELLIRGKQKLASTGNFSSSRWQDGLHTSAEPRSGALTNARIDMWHDVWFAHIHEFGGIIQGKPLLWIPLSFAGVPKDMWARDFPGGLFRVDRPGKAPLLLSRDDGQPKYFGKTQVYVPPRWHLSELAFEIMQNFVTHYDKNKQVRR